MNGGSGGTNNDIVHWNINGRKNSTRYRPRVMFIPLLDNGNSVTVERNLFESEKDILQVLRNQSISQNFRDEQSIPGAQVPFKLRSYFDFTWDGGVMEETHKVNQDRSGAWSRGGFQANLFNANSIRHSGEGSFDNAPVGGNETILLTVPSNLNTINFMFNSGGDGMSNSFMLTDQDGNFIGGGTTTGGNDTQFDFTVDSSVTSITLTVFGADGTPGDTFSFHAVFQGTDANPVTVPNSSSASVSGGTNSTTEGVQVLSNRSSSSSNPINRPR